MLLHNFKRTGLTKSKATSGSHQHLTDGHKNGILFPNFKVLTGLEITDLHEVLPDNEFTVLKLLSGVYSPNRFWMNPYLLMEWNNISQVKLSAQLLDLYLANLEKFKENNHGIVLAYCNKTQIDLQTLAHNKRSDIPMVSFTDVGKASLVYQGLTGFAFNFRWYPEPRTYILNKDKHIVATHIDTELTPQAELDLTLSKLQDLSLEDTKKSRNSRKL
ncbi:MAG: hypothetical protein JSS07_05990 [Proteobacteria bacterium]|nr:hypothetical protein [Pseudomonadota bacterium]